MAKEKKTKKAKKAKEVASSNPELEIAKINAPVDMFKAVATFGFLAAVMFCIGGPLVIAVSPELGKCIGRMLVIFGGIIGVAVVAFVLWFYWKLSGLGSSSSPVASDQH